MKGKLVKAKLMQLHALERAALSQQQQLMQIRAQQRRVVTACRNLRNSRGNATRECELHQQAEKRHRSDAEDLKARIEYTKARFVLPPSTSVGQSSTRAPLSKQHQLNMFLVQALAPECVAELEKIDQAYEDELAKIAGLDECLQTLARSRPNGT